MKCDDGYRIVNNTRVVFDNKLKLCVMNIPAKLKKELMSYDYIMLQKTQEQIRDYFVTHQYDINIAGKLTHGYHSCPDFYSLLCAVVADLPNCETWDDVYDQLDSSNKDNLTYYDASNNNITLCGYDRNDVNSIEEQRCMCGQYCFPHNMTIVTNKSTKLSILIGGHCIDKIAITMGFNFITKKKESDAYAKIMYKYKLKNEQKQLQDKIKKEKTKNINCMWEKLVYVCIDKNNTSRKCEGCNKLCILKTEPEWKKKCINCFYSKPVGVCLLKKRC